ncbi:hypothetical protein ACQY0O_001178 [Thecaphora frezii]
MMSLSYFNPVLRLAMFSAGPRLSTPTLNPSLHPHFHRNIPVAPRTKNLAGGVGVDITRRAMSSSATTLQQMSIRLETRSRTFRKRYYALSGGGRYTTQGDNSCSRCSDGRYKESSKDVGALEKWYTLRFKPRHIKDVHAMEMLRFASYLGATSKAGRPDMLAERVKSNPKHVRMQLTFLHQSVTNEPRKATKTQNCITVTPRFVRFSVILKGVPKKLEGPNLHAHLEDHFKELFTNDNLSNKATHQPSA